MQTRLHIVEYFIGAIAQLANERRALIINSALLILRLRPRRRLWSGSLAQLVHHVGHLRDLINQIKFRG